MIGSITTFLQINNKYHRHKITGYYVPIIINYLLSTVINCDPEPKIHVVQETTKVKSLLQSYNHIGFNDNHWEPSAQLILCVHVHFLRNIKKCLSLAAMGLQIIKLVCLNCYLPHISSIQFTIRIPISCLTWIICSVNVLLSRSDYAILISNICNYRFWNAYQYYWMKCLCA